MARYIVLGSYTKEGAQGLVDASTDRRAAMEALHASVGAKLVDYYLTRGQYDFCVIAEADSFSVVAAMTLKPRASGAVENLVTLEAIDVEEIQNIAQSAGYTPPSG